MITKRELNEILIAALKLREGFDIAREVSESEPVTRRLAARMTHEAMRAAGIPDLTKLAPAEQLKDLYDCNTCVAHVTQVYLRGLIEAHRQKTENESEILLFDAEALLSSAETVKLKDGLIRLQENGEDKKCLSKQAQTSTLEGTIRFGLKEALARIQQEHGTLIDVRSRREYEESHLPGAVSLPMGELLINPYRAGNEKNQVLWLYCDAGYQSEIAANCLYEHGYSKVFYFATKENTEET